MELIYEGDVTNRGRSEEVIETHQELSWFILDVDHLNES